MVPRCNTVDNSYCEIENIQFESAGNTSAAPLLPAPASPFASMFLLIDSRRFGPPTSGSLLSRAAGRKILRVMMSTYSLRTPRHRLCVLSLQPLIYLSKILERNHGFRRIGGLGKLKASMDSTRMGW